VTVPFAARDLARPRQPWSSTRRAVRVLRLLARAAVYAAVILTVACASGKKRPPTGGPEPDKFLFESGTEALSSTKWLTAREYFREIVDNYPQSTYRADAKLGLGDTYLGENTAESRVLAINEFREFLSYYPTHPRADSAQYKLGLSHYSQMLGPQRDQSETKEAITEFAAFLERYPNSQYTEEVRTKEREAKDRLGQSEYRVGLFYYRVKWYPGAIDRFKALLARDPDFTHRDAVYFYLGESLVKTSKPAEALPYYERLVAEFDKSEFLEDAKHRIAELKPGYAH
jgi:outer membrane protein assembly factor BamD